MENGNLEKLKGSRRYKLALILIIFTFFYITLLTGIKALLPNFQVDKEIVFLITGFLFGTVTTALGFYFGNSEKEDKNELN